MGCTFEVLSHPGTKNARLQLGFNIQCMSRYQHQKKHQKKHHSWMTKFPHAKKNKNQQSKNRAGPWQLMLGGGKGEGWGCGHQVGQMRCQHQPTRPTVLTTTPASAGSWGDFSLTLFRVTPNSDPPLWHYFASEVWKFGSVGSVYVITHETQQKTGKTVWKDRKTENTWPTAKKSGVWNPWVQKHRKMWDLNARSFSRRIQIAFKSFLWGGRIHELNMEDVFTLLMYTYFPPLLYSWTVIFQRFEN